MELLQIVEECLSCRRRQKLKVIYFKTGEYDGNYITRKMEFKLQKEVLEKLDKAMQKIASQLFEKKELWQWNVLVEEIVQVLVLVLVQMLVRDSYYRKEKILDEN